MVDKINTENKRVKFSPVIKMKTEYELKECMCCKRPFESEGKFNRICSRCKDDHRNSAFDNERN